MAHQDPNTIPLHKHWVGICLEQSTQNVRLLMFNYMKDASVENVVRHKTYMSVKILRAKLVFLSEYFQKLSRFVSIRQAW